MHNKFFGFVAIFLIAGQHSEAQSFNKTQIAITPEPYIDSNIEWIDLDGDQDLDIVELYSHSSDAQQSIAKVYRREGQIFTAVPNAFGGVTVDPRDYDFNDFDRDGDIDLLFVDSEAIKVAVNNGSGIFTIQNTNIDNPGNWRELHWRDLDGDQDPDIVFETFIYLNTSGNFSPALFKMPAYTRNRSWADVNNDGLVDMIATKGQTFGINPLFLFINQGSGLFKEMAKLSDGYWDSGNTEWLDADADDDLDLFITEVDDKCTLFRNTFTETGDAVFQRARSFTTLTSPHVDAGDVNLDGLPDIIINGQTLSGSKTYLYLNATRGPIIDYTESELQINPFFVSNFEFQDLDADSHLDLFVLGWQDSGYEIRVQDVYLVNPQNTRANVSVPGNLTASIGTNVTLSWNHNDNQGAAYFAVTLKRNGLPFSSGFTAGSGKLVVPDRLSFQTAKQTILRDLPAGNYEWKVEAYDHAYRASGFSAASLFTIMDPPTGVTLDVLEYNKVKVNWQFTGTATHFSVWRRSSNGAITEIGTVPSGIAYFTDEDVPPNEHVEYIVKAIFNESYSAPSSSVAYYSSQFDQTAFNPAGPNVVTATGVSADFDNDQDFDLAFAGRIDLLTDKSIKLVNNGSGQYSETTLLPDATDALVPMIARDMEMMATSIFALWLEATSVDIV